MSEPRLEILHREVKVLKDDVQELKGGKNPGVFELCRRTNDMVMAMQLDMVDVKKDIASLREEKSKLRGMALATGAMTGFFGWLVGFFTQK